jgi:thioredoxin-related protein
MHRSLIKSLMMFALVFTSATLFAQGIKFEENLSWSEIKAKARDENKYIFLDIYTTWCGPCKVMDVGVYPNEKVGALMNEKFIAVKVQQDQTANDNSMVKSWYSDAQLIIDTYKVEAFPSFLFFSPDGRLMHRALGFQNVTAFNKIAETALTNPMEGLYKQIAGYKQGHKEYTTLPELIKNVREVQKDDQLATEIAMDYKVNFLEKLSEKELLNKKHLDFIGENFNLINSNDRFFKLCYEQPGKVDFVKDYDPGSWANIVVTQTIGREEIEPRLWKDKKPLHRKPDWQSIIAVVKKKYPKVNSEELISNAKDAYYKTIKDYEEFAKRKNANPPVAQSSMLSDSWALNSQAWTLFENSSDKDALTTALSWSDLSIRLDSLNILKTHEMPNTALYDTKANLLYKLGRVDEAIAWEQKAIDQGIINAKKRGDTKGDFYDDYMAIIEKMKKGEATWPENN